MTDGSQRKKSSVQDLTQRQIDVLARVSQFKSSKQIARELGISHHTVDQRIKTILDKMGVGSRADAARTFLESRHNNGLSESATCESLACRIPDLAEDPFLAEPKTSPRKRNPAAEGHGQRMNEAQALDIANDPRASENPPLIMVLLRADCHKDQSAWGRTICVILTILLTLIVVVFFIGLKQAIETSLIETVNE